MTTSFRITIVVIVGFFFLYATNAAVADESMEPDTDTELLLNDDEPLTDEDPESIDDSDEPLSDEDSELIDDGDEPLTDEDPELYDEEMNDDEVAFDGEGDESQIEDDPELADGDDVSPAREIADIACAKTLKTTVTSQNTWKLEPAGVQVVHRFSIIKICNNSDKLLEVGFLPTTYIASGTNSEIEPYECKLFHVDKPKSKPAQSFLIRGAFVGGGLVQKDGFLICK